MANRTYRYFDGKPLYPFGYGLSYTHFVYSDATYENGAVSVCLRNAGEYASDEVVQVYIKDHDSACAVRNHSLCAFRRVHLAPGEEVTVTLPVLERAFACVDETGRSAVTGKRFTLFVGGGQPDERTAELTGDRCLALSINLA